MLFSTATFLFVFLPCVLLLYYMPFVKNRTYRNILLAITSIFFYAWGEPAFVLVMLASILVNWLLALWVDKYRGNASASKVILAFTVVFNLSFLFVFKYLAFVVNGFSSLFGGNDVLQITLPIGISFYTFQAMSYVLDVYRQRGRAQKNPLNVALYIAFFPQLIAGPIVRYETIAEQIENRKETFDDFCAGFERFMIGFSKKIIIANNIAIVADEIFAANAPALLTAWIGVIAYAFQIFFDFSGYSDMAIGMGRMFGFHFLENFNYPYISKSISEFWRRWHVSLGTWFRDYVYFPLGGSRVATKRRLVLNLFVVWFLTGIWHGANWTFMLWGVMYFVLITAEKLTNFPSKIKGLGHIYTLFFVLIGWVIFRADSLAAARCI